MTAAKKTATPVDTAVAAGKETFEKMAKVGRETVKENVEKAISIAKDNVEKSSETLFKGYDQLATLAQGNMEAVTNSVTIMTKGFEEVSKAYVTFAQGAFDASMAFGKGVMGAKSVNEIVDLHNAYTKDSFEKLVAEGAKISEMSVKTANDALTPLKKRVDETVETLVKPLAA